MSVGTGIQFSLRAGACALAALWAGVSGLPAQEADFNEARLQAGKAAYQMKLYSDAIDEFRVAAFGFLDDPARLEQTLVRLALAQAAAGKTPDADATLNRFMEVEGRFKAYAKASLEPQTRADFRSLFAKELPRAPLPAEPTKDRP